AVREGLQRRAEHAGAGGSRELAGDDRGSARRPGRAPEMAHDAARGEDEDHVLGIARRRGEARERANERIREGGRSAELEETAAIGAEAVHLQFPAHAWFGVFKLR